jgi:glycosyltransferase involved in cell wall biosynthesis
MDKNSPKVSIIIISYNQEKFIADAIISAVRQDYANCEVVACDDGSSDKTQQIIYDLHKQYPAKIVPLLNAKNLGITGNCNRALGAATGDFVALMGGDDILYPEKISKQIQCFDNHRELVLCGHLGENIDDQGDRILIDGKHIYHGEASSGNGPLKMIKRQHSPHPISLMVRRTAIPQHGFDEAITMSSDYMFVLEVLAGGGSYTIMNQCLAQRRIHGNNISQDQNRMFRDLKLTYEIFSSRYPQYAKACQEAIVDQVHYYQGAVQLRNWRESRKHLALALRDSPLHVKSLIRYSQTILFQFAEALKIK